MKTLKLSIALAMSFAGIVYANGYIENTVKNVDIQVYSDSAIEHMTKSNVVNIDTFTVKTVNTDGVEKPPSADCDNVKNIACDDGVLFLTERKTHAFIEGTANEDGSDDDTKACDDIMDDLCENGKEIREALGSSIFT